MTVTVDTKVKRGPESWSYIYIALGFALTIEPTVVSMIEPLKFPWNIITYLIVGGLTFWLFLNNGWFQNKLVGLKIRYEEKLH
jgi:hypothetical protein